MTRPIACGAEFSPCRHYRYALWRDWDWQGYAHRVAFVGLNPSTADETADDPTIRRCIGFARRWGFGGIVMLNLYGWRSTDPAGLMSATDPVGPQNDEMLAYYRSQVGLVVACWGSLKAAWRPRVAWGSRIELVLSGGCLGSGPVYCLGRNRDGEPKHPLYLRHDVERELFSSPPE